MTITASSPFAPLAESLATLTRSADCRALRDHLLGRTLPAIGGNTEPTEIILQALEEAPHPNKLAARLASVLALVVDECSAELEGGELTQSLEFLLDQTLRLAADLSPNPNLAFSLLRLITALEATVHDFWEQNTLPHLAVRALVHQQTDAKAEALWYHMLRTSLQGSSWTPMKRTILLDAWRGLLYIPPDAKAARAGQIIDVHRIDQGLRAVETGAGSPENGARMVLQALRILDQTFPRSPQFWTKYLGPLFERWSPVLQAAAVQLWPGLRHTPSRRTLMERFKIKLGQFRARYLSPLGAIRQKENLAAPADERKASSGPGNFAHKVAGSSLRRYSSRNVAQKSLVDIGRGFAPPMATLSEDMRP